MLPGICCVIPLSDPRREYLLRLDVCLRSLDIQTLDSDQIDVVVAYVRQGRDTTASDSALAHLGRLCMRHGAALVFDYHEYDDWAPALTRNVGGRWSRRELVTFLDVDAVMHPRWAEVVTKVMKQAERPTAVTVKTKMITEPWDSGFYREMVSSRQAFERLIRVSAGHIAHGTGCGTVTTTDLYESLGGLDELLVGYGPTDIDFTDRLRAHGVDLLCLTEAAAICIGHQEHDRAMQAVPLELSESKKRNTKIMQEALGRGEIVRNRPLGWGGLPWP